MNLLSIANRLVAAVNPNEPCEVFKFLEQVNERGAMASYHAAGVPALIQIQSEKADELARAGINLATLEETRRAWISLEPGLEPQSRPKVSGGDVVKRKDGTWWLVTAKLEDFGQAGWTCARLTLQVEPPRVKPALEPEPPENPDD